MENSSFFNSVNGDRKYKAEDFANFFNSLVANGIFPNPATNLQVMANGNMTVTVKAGKGWINGYLYYNDSDLVTDIDVADGVLNRIDRIVMRMDTAGRAINAIVKKGTFASLPVAPTLEQDADGFELALADIYVGNGVTSISQANITDQRLNTSLCGIVGSLIQPDTTAIFNQYQAWFNSQSATYNTQMAANEADFANQFNTWFNNVKGQLGTDVAGNLQNEIDTANNNLTQHIEDNSKHIPYGVTSNTGNKYAISINNLSSLPDGQPISVKFNADSTGAVTLNVNNLGDIPIIDSLKNVITDVRAGSIVNLRYNVDTSNFILLGKGGGADNTTDVISTLTVTAGQSITSKNILSNNGDNTVRPIFYNTKTDVLSYPVGTTQNANYPYNFQYQGLLWDSSRFIAPTSGYSSTNQYLSVYDMSCDTPKIASKILALFYTSSLGGNGFHIIKINDSTGIIFYCNNVNIVLYYRFFTLVGNEVYLDVQKTLSGLFYPAGWPYAGMKKCIAKLVDNGDLILYVQDGNGTSFLCAVSVDLVGMTLTVKSGGILPDIFSNSDGWGRMHVISSAYPVRVALLGTCNRDDIGGAQICDISSTGTVTKYTRLQLSLYASSGNYQDSYKINSTTIALFSLEHDGGGGGPYGMLTTLTISGTTISKAGLSNKTSAPAPVKAFFLLNNGTNYGAIWASGGTYYFSTFTSAGSTTNTVLTDGSGNNMQPSQAYYVGYINAVDAMFVQQQSGGYTKRYSVNSSNVFGHSYPIYVSPMGVATVNASAGQNTQIQRSGIISGLSNLTPGASYFAQIGGSIGLTGVVFIGVAISATELCLSKTIAYSKYVNQLSKIVRNYTVNGTATTGNVVKLASDGTISNLPIAAGSPAVGIYQGNGKVLLKGISNVHSNLVPDSDYYYNSSGVISTTNTGTFIGTAISPTELLVPNYIF